MSRASSGTATTVAEAREVAAKIGFPLVVRPSYVLGGRAMAIVYDMGTLDRYMTNAVAASPGPRSGLCERITTPKSAAIEKRSSNAYCPAMRGATTCKVELS